jgi:hypothetical protein
MLYKVVMPLSLMWFFQTERNEPQDSEEEAAVMMICGLVILTSLY